MNQLGKICTACQIERRKRGSIKYHPDTLMPYCENPYICNEQHPNSPTNLINRAHELGTENATLHLIEFDEAQEKFGIQLTLNHPDKDRAEKIRKMVKMPFTIRIATPDRAEFLLSLQDELGLDNVTETVRYCIDMMKDARGGYYQVHKEIEKEEKHEAEVKAAFAEIGVQVEKKEPAEEKAGEENDDEDFTF